MQSKKQNIESLLSDKKFLKFQSLGLIDEIALRNLRIKSEYRSLKKSVSMYEAIFQLSEKYSLSTDSINSILFRKRRRKNLAPQQVSA